MSVQIDRALRIIEMLATERAALPLHEISGRLDMPKSGCHRILSALIAGGFVQQEPGTQRYEPTLKIAILGFRFLASTGLKDICQPELRRLSRETGELARLAVLDNERLHFVSEAQGATWGLRFDANLGREAVLHATAAGKAWLATLSNEEATRIVLSQGFGKGQNLGPNAVRDIPGLLAELEKTRETGVGIAREEAEPGVTSVAVPVRVDGAEPSVVGCVIVVAPSARMPEERIAEIVPLIGQAAEKMGDLWPIRFYGPVSQMP